MPLSIDPASLLIILNSDKAIVLGIIDEGDVVRLKISDPLQFPGHVEWLAREQMSAKRGFSLLVHDGRVTSVFPRSRLNRTPNAELELDVVQSLLKLLPVSESVEILD